jgi:hypothetical protein
MDRMVALEKAAIGEWRGRAVGTDGVVWRIAAQGLDVHEAFVSRSRPGRVQFMGTGCAWPFSR